MKYAIYTLGCKVNQYETQAIETMLRQRGFERAERDADVAIVNTCAVTAESGRKSRQAVRRLQSRNPGALTVVCGCFSQLEPEAAKDLGADIVFGSGDRRALADAIERALPVTEVDDPFRRTAFEPLPAGAVSGRTRAMLKIQDGCDNFCAYCVIPYARGRVRSLPLADCAAQGAALAGKGFAEIVVTGIEIASYGKDLPGKPGLADAVEAIGRAAPTVRLRLGSLEPTVATEDFCRRLAALGNVCPHFHLSLQSGCDDTLARMGRKYDTAAFAAVCGRLRRAFPGCSLTADLICGFPGESEADFAETLAFIEQCGFFHVHAFPYSVRPGTRAAAMPGQLSRAEKEARVRRAAAVAEKTKAAYLESCVGKTLSVLFESGCEGHAGNYCPVRASGGAARGRVLPVRVTGAAEGILLGTVEKSGGTDLQSRGGVL